MDKRQEHILVLMLESLMIRYLLQTQEEIVIPCITITTVEDNIVPHVKYKSKCYGATRSSNGVSTVRHYRLC